METSQQPAAIETFKKFNRLLRTDRTKLVKRGRDGRPCVAKVCLEAVMAVAKEKDEGVGKGEGQNRMRVVRARVGSGLE